MPATSFERLPRRERQIMDALYQLGKATVSEVMAQLPDPPSYSAVRATLRVLEDKGFVKHRQDGPRYVYLAAVPRDAARRAALQHLVTTFFEGSNERALLALLQMSDTRLPDTDIERLAELIQQAQAEGR